jgi:predicted dehydrogenase
MESRRSFISKLSKSTALTAIAITPAAASEMVSGLLATNRGNEKKIRIGIIGAENTHTAGYGKLFNIDKKFPGIEVLYVWGETEEFAKSSMEKGSIPNMVKDPEEMLGKIDALIVDHRHAKYHLEAATPFVKEGIPTFIDKPFCYRVSEGKEFLAMARELGTPVTSYSSIAHSDATFDIKKQLETMGEINQVVRFGPAELDSKYGGIFFYGVHSVQPLMYMFGEDIREVRITRNGKNAGASLAYENGMLATLVFKNLHYGWDTFVETKEGIIRLESRVEEADPPRHYADMVEMFRTGKEPRSHQSMLNCVAVLEALERSVESDRWEEVQYQLI